MKHIIHSLALLLALLTVTLACGCGGDASSGYVFQAQNGTEIRIGALADTVIPKLGNYISMSESASCGGLPGNDRVYVYAGYRVKTTPAEGGDVVCQIELTDDSVKTPEGLYIGMPIADAHKAMGGKGNELAMGSSYTKGGTKLQISVRDGAVFAIAYLEA